ncbi:MULTISPECIES: helix-turn-helix domain-containing protein [Pseudomonas]|uniref:helix-turn-helix domain-containing protein n=1 Tax=Pseudomonas TaxID=286 RepID=UPI0002A155CF|nr:MULTISPECIES: helix-turn-helix domain-containing protein [Pseudomonas]AGA72624.1 cI repressor protein [Pseudomonas putida HB3267]MCE0757210.1 helix-turn-helix domain-containing protein [Pseudomonas asiatica]MCE0854003.1 helix-turn-helix domain-containing protein [Pseudomonas asiatica]MCE0944050.1 helix-turn-helix domain-containing protein [Pseudomonas asiatica]MCE0956021.1 helix-turn-helix domain-containing protein [Pseudomonas asiatica]
MTKPIRTPLSPEQLEDARRLREIYQARVRESRDDPSKPKLTQTEVGERCEWKSPQSTVSQYMNGKVALNLEALLKLSKALEFKIEDVSPSLAESLKDAPVGHHASDAPESIVADALSRRTAWYIESGKDAAFFESILNDVPLTLRIRHILEGIGKLVPNDLDELSKAAVGVNNHATEILLLLDSLLEAAAHDALDLDDITTMAELVNKRRNEKVHGVNLERKET